MENALHYSKLDVPQPSCLINVKYNRITHGTMAITDEINKTTCFKCKEQLKKISGNKFYDRYIAENDKISKAEQRNEEKKSIRENNKLLLRKWGFK